MNSLNSQYFSHLPENILDSVLSGGVPPLEGEPIVKTTGGGLSKPGKSLWQPEGGAVGANKGLS